MRITAVLGSLWIFISVKGMRYEKKIRQLEKTQDMMTMIEIWQIIRVILYLAYDTSKEFLPQFEFNSEKLLKLLDDIPALKRMVYHGR